MFTLRWLPILFASVALLSLSGCDSSPVDGPVEVRWDRDSCEKCSMLISDRKFAAQYRDGAGKIHLFDDPGEMFLSFWEQTKGDKAAKLYVTDAISGKWLDARTAHFSDGHHTPMGYGYGAHELAQEGSMDFAALMERIKNGEKGAPTPLSHSHQPAKPQEMATHNMLETQNMTRPHSNFHSSDK